MNALPIDQLPPRVAGHALALLGASHGYRFDGDTAYLSATFVTMSPAAGERSWALQLWATPNAPTSDADLAGRLVAHADLPPISEVANSAWPFEFSTPAFLPTSSAGHYMVMTLVAGREGKFEELHDLVLLPQRQTFQPLRIGGAVSYHVQGDRMHLSVEKIENPRWSGSLSGTLALELWALSGPYQGGPFRGSSLAGVTLDPLSGLQEYGFHSFDLPFTPPPAGLWHFVLMLREWTPAGFVTRDFTNFPNPHFQPEPPPPPVEVCAPALPERLIESLAIEAPAHPAPLIEEATNDLPASHLPPAHPEQPAPKRSRRRKAARPLGEVSVNTARAKTLSGVKWLSKRVAAGIVAGRPFDSLDDLIRVKGVGPKVLARVRERLKL